MRTLDFSPQGTLPDGGRSLLSLNPIDDIDLTLLKRFTLTEHFGWSSRFAPSISSIIRNIRAATLTTLLRLAPRLAAEAMHRVLR